MKHYITREELIALVDNDHEFVAVLIEQQVIVESTEGFASEDVDRALASRTLVHELEVNWAGVDIILRLREELARARQRITELEQGDTLPPKKPR